MELFKGIYGQLKKRSLSRNANQSTFELSYVLGKLVSKILDYVLRDLKRFGGGLLSRSFARDLDRSRKDIWTIAHRLHASIVVTAYSKRRLST
jgi:hypothetical protein